MTKSQLETIRVFDFLESGRLWEKSHSIGTENPADKAVEPVGEVFSPNVGPSDCNDEESNAKEA
jgi:hypothetical protein